MTTSGWIVSVVTIDDLPEIFAIDNQSPSPWTYAQLEGEFFGTHGLQLVCRRPDNKQITGFIIGRTVVDEAEILRIATRAEDQHQGAACGLISEFIRQIKAKGSHKCYLELRSTNTPARRLYEKFDFQVTGLRKNYYSEPCDDALCMSLSLS